MLQFAQHLRFDLADAFARHRELLAQLFKPEINFMPMRDARASASSIHYTSMAVVDRRPYFGGRRPGLLTHASR